MSTSKKTETKAAEVPNGKMTGELFTQLCLDAIKKRIETGKPESFVIVNGEKRIIHIRPNN